MKSHGEDWSWVLQSYPFLDSESREEEEDKGGVVDRKTKGNPRAVVAEMVAAVIGMEPFG